MPAFGADQALAVVILGNAADKLGHPSKVTCRVLQIKVVSDFVGQTERSSSEPRGSTLVGDAALLPARPDGGEAACGAGTGTPPLDESLRPRTERCNGAARDRPACAGRAEKAARDVELNMRGIINCIG